MYSWRPCWACPSLRWVWMTVHSQTVVSPEAAAMRFHSARPQWLSAPVTSLWCHYRPLQRHSVAARAGRWSTCPAPLTPQTLASMGAPVRMDRWDTGRYIEVEGHFCVYLCVFCSWIPILQYIREEIKYKPIKLSFKFACQCSLNETNSTKIMLQQRKFLFIINYCNSFICPSLTVTARCFYNFHLTALIRIFLVVCSSLKFPTVFLKQVGTD